MSPTAIKAGALAVAVAVSGAAGWYISELFLAEDGAPIQVTDRGDRGGAQIGGPFELVDGAGKTWTDKDFRGRLMLIYFGFTYCPDVCPTSLAAVADALEKLGPAASQVAPLFVTVDPERDHGEQLGAYGKAFDPRILGLGGSIEQITKAAKAYRVYFRKVPGKDGGDYLVDHSSVLYLMDREGRFAGHFPHSATGDQILAGLRKAL